MLQSPFRPLARAACILALAAATQAAGAAPAETVLHDFDVIPGGNQLQAAPTPGPGGVYYGTSDGGGATGNGTVFELVPPAAGQSGWTATVIHDFSGAPDGAIPSSGLLAGKGGVLYGVAANGGAHGYGVVFKLTPPAAGQAAWTETILYSFKGGSDGIAPYGTLIADGNGVLYGATAGGGTASSTGTAFSLTPPPDGKAAWTEAVLYVFQGGTDGTSPAGGLLRDDTGALFGLTELGGTSNAGTVYRLTPPATGKSAWTKTILHSFTGQPDGFFPVGGLVRDQAGILYGVTNTGGASGSGTVFSLAAPSAGQKAWSETLLYSFSGSLDGGAPSATPILAPDGTLYGTSNGGGTAGIGTVFALTPPATAGKAWTEAALVSFTGPNGANPAGLVRDAAGALLGTTFAGGFQNGGGGTVFRLTPPKTAGAEWSQTVLQRFLRPGGDATQPGGALLLAKSGAIFGSAANGGAQASGAVFRLRPPGTGETAWHESVIHSFAGADGYSPVGGLIEGAKGVLYGMTNSGGADNDGTVFALTPPPAGQAAWSEKVLYSFKGGTDGAFPNGALTAGTGGALYGTAVGGGTQFNGIVFKLTPPAKSGGGWSEAVLYRFTGPDGSGPNGTLLLGTGGVLYGATSVGGAAGEGTIFKLTPPAKAGGSWSEVVLHSFNAANGKDGATPGSQQLVMDAAGALYGTAGQGGAGNLGIVFKLAPPTGAGKAWTETVLHSFTGDDGSWPYAGLLVGGGALYGVTALGGDTTAVACPANPLEGTPPGCGVVFMLTPPAVAGRGWTEGVLHKFNPIYGRDGATPNGVLIQDAGGNLYGAASGGGRGGSGIVFKIAP